MLTRPEYPSLGAKELPVQSHLVFSGESQMSAEDEVGKGSEVRSAAERLCFRFETIVSDQ